MKIALIIPIYNQSKYWERIVSGIKKQSTKPSVVYVVIDRPNDDKGPLSSSGEPEMPNWDAVAHIHAINEKSPEIQFEILTIQDVPANLTRSNSDHIFLAGQARNIGVERALKCGMDIFVFIDGDCIPQPDLITSHVKKCEISTLPILSNGRRREMKYRWRDQRETIPQLTHLDMFRIDGYLINSSDMLKQCLIVWSCNMALNLKAVLLIRKLNARYYNRSELFNSNFLGAWGGEDSFLGVQAWVARIFITMIGEKGSGVEHIDHPRVADKYTIDHKSFFTNEMDTFTKKVSINPLSVDFFM